MEASVKPPMGDGHSAVQSRFHQKLYVDEDCPETGFDEKEKKKGRSITQGDGYEME